MGFLESFGTLSATLLLSVFLIVFAVIYFGITLWVIKVASNLFFGTGLEANWAVLSAAILTTGSLLAASKK